jgi:hypothetical protein
MLRLRHLGLVCSLLANNFEFSANHGPFLKNLPKTFAGFDRRFGH